MFMWMAYYFRKLKKKRKKKKQLQYGFLFREKNGLLDRTSITINKQLRACREDYGSKVWFVADHLVMSYFNYGFCEIPFTGI